MPSLHDEPVAIHWRDLCLLQALEGLASNPVLVRGNAIGDAEGGVPFPKLKRLVLWGLDRRLVPRRRFVSPRRLCFDLNTPLT